MRALLLAVLGSVLVYAVLAAITDAQAVASALRDFPLTTLAAMVVLTLACYGLRAVRWRFLVGRVNCPLNYRDATYIQFSGMTMTVTPGKLGEVLKAYLAHQICGLRMSRGVAIVFCERLADLIAVLVLSVGGVSLLGGGWLALAIAALPRAGASLRRVTHVGPEAPRVSVRNLGHHPHRAHASSVRRRDQHRYRRVGVRGPRLRPRAQSPRLHRTRGCARNCRLRGVDGDRCARLLAGGHRADRGVDGGTTRRGRDGGSRRYRGDGSDPTGHDVVRRCARVARVREPASPVAWVLGGRLTQ